MKTESTSNIKDTGQNKVEKHNMKIHIYYLSKNKKNIQDNEIIYTMDSIKENFWREKRALRIKMIGKRKL